MTKIRKINIKNFRSIKLLDWCPRESSNCLIGLGNSGKSTILDAIDLCLSARRNISFNDSDFYRLDSQNPIKIDLTLGDLPEELLDIDRYGIFHHAYHAHNGSIDEEPAPNAETVITVRLFVDDSLEPIWSLVSKRAEAAGVERVGLWREKKYFSPIKLGEYVDYHFTWRRGSLLSIYSERSAVGNNKALAEASRAARNAFSIDKNSEISDVLESIKGVCDSLGVSEKNLEASIDPKAVSLGEGVVSLHDENSVPMRALGLGSKRLLLAALRRELKGDVPIVIVDELEMGLEPHRVQQFLSYLGVKDSSDDKSQTFLATHSPVAVREIGVSGMTLVRSGGDSHEIFPLDDFFDIQGSLRLYPDAFFAKKVLVCEGASEVGLARGIARYEEESNPDAPSMSGRGVAFVDANGVSKVAKQAMAFFKLGYDVAILRDSDKSPPKADEDELNATKVKTFKWDGRLCIEEALFVSLPANAIIKLLDYAIDLKGKDLVQQKVRSESSFDLEDIMASLKSGTLERDARCALGKISSSGTKDNQWFKTVGKMEKIGYEIVGPSLKASTADFQAVIEQFIRWALD